MAAPKVQAFYELWQHKHDWFDLYLSALDNTMLQEAPAPSMNHGVWILTHLLADEDNLADYLGKGTVYYPAYQQDFAPGQPVKPVEDCPSPGRLRHQWQEVRDKNEAVLARLTDNELTQPHIHYVPGPEKEIETKQLCIMNRILHVAHHAGQLALLLRKHGKNVF